MLAAHFSTVCHRLLISKRRTASWNLIYSGQWHSSRSYSLSRHRRSSAPLAPFVSRVEFVRRSMLESAFLKSAWFFNRITVLSCSPRVSIRCGTSLAVWNGGVCGLGGRGGGSRSPQLRLLPCNQWRGFAITSVFHPHAPSLLIARAPQLCAGRFTRLSFNFLHFSPVAAAPFCLFVASLLELPRTHLHRWRGWVHQFASVSIAVLHLHPHSSLISRSVHSL